MTERPVWWDKLAFPSCSVPTGVPTDRKADLRAEEAAHGIMQRQSKKGSSSVADQEMIWSLYVLKKKGKKKAQHPLKVNEPHIISCLPSTQWSCYYWVFFNPPTRPPLPVYWKVKQMVSLHLLRRLSNSVTFGNGGWGGRQSELCHWHLCRLEECIPVCVCNSTWHFYYVWNW